MLKNREKSIKISISLFGKRCSRTSLVRHASTEKERALWFFLLDRNGQTWVYRLVWGPTEVWFRRNRNFPTEDDNYAPLGITRVKQGRNLASFQRKPKFIFKNLVEPKLKPFIDYEVNKVWIGPDERKKNMRKELQNLMFSLRYYTKPKRNFFGKPCRYLGWYIGVLGVSITFFWFLLLLCGIFGQLSVFWIQDGFLNRSSNWRIM